MLKHLQLFCNASLMGWGATIQKDGMIDHLQGHSWLQSEITFKHCGTSGCPQIFSKESNKFVQFDPFTVYRKHIFEYAKEARFTQECHTSSDLHPDSQIGSISQHRPSSSSHSRNTKHVCRFFKKFSYSPSRDKSLRTFL